MTGLPLDPDDPAARAAFVFALTNRYPMRPRSAETLYHLARGLTRHEGLGAAMAVGNATIGGYLADAFAALAVHDVTNAVLAIWPTYVRAKRQGAAIAPLAREAA